MTGLSAPAACRTIVLLPDLAEVAVARRLLSETIADAGFSEERAFDIAVACSEAIANAIEHAPVKGEVRVRAVLWSDRLEVEVEGPGEFQAPKRQKERGSRGLGLPLMAKLADHLALFSGPDGRTFVSLTFYLPGAKAREAGPLPPAFALRAVERAAQEDRERLLRVIDGISDEVWFADARGQMTLVNPSGRQEFRLEGGEGEPIEAIASRFEVYRGDMTPRPVAEAPPLRALAGETIREELEIVRTPRTGELRHRMVNAAPVRDMDGRIVGSVSVVHDITERVKMERAAAWADDLTRTALKDSLVSLSAQDRELQYLWAFNLKTAGAEEVVGKTDRDLFPVAEAGLLEAIKRDVLAKGTERHEQLWVTSPHGPSFLDLHLRPLRDEAGDVTGVLTTSIDMTEQRNLEGAFQRSESQLTYLLELSDALRTLADPAEIQASAAQILGERLGADRVFYAEIVEENGADYLVVGREHHAPGLPDVPDVKGWPGRAPLAILGEAAGETLRAGSILCNSDVGGATNLGDEERAALLSLGVGSGLAVPLVKRGKLVALLGAVRAAPRSWTGDELALAAQTAERTWAEVQRAVAERELRDRERLLDLAMEAGRAAPFEIDLVNREVKASPGLCALFGAEPRAGLRFHEDWRELVEPDDREQMARSLEQARLLGTEDHVEYRVVFADGSIHWLETHGLPVANERGQYVRLVGFVTDITERKLTEEALRRGEERYRKIAEQLQSALLDIPAEIGPVKLGHLYISATEAARVGGDFYDVFEAKQGKIAVLVGDVSGHGIQAARTATLVKDVVHAFTHQSVRPQEVLKRTNALLIEKDLQGFVSLFLGILDPQTGTFRYASAGHPETLLRRVMGTIESLGVGSSPLGVFSDARWRPGRVELQAGDMLLLYTDGVVEARRKGEFFGKSRLEALLKRKELSVQRLPHLLLDQVLAFSEGRLQDDVAVLALALEEKTSSPSRHPVQERLLD